MSPARMDNWELAAWVDEYQFFVEQGMPARLVHERLGVSDQEAHRRLARSGKWIIDQENKRINNELMRLIDRGEAFSINDFSELHHGSAVAAILQRATGAGLITKVRMTTHWFEAQRKVPVYMPARR